MKTGDRVLTKTVRAAVETDALERALEPVVAGAEAELVDLEYRAGVLLVTVERRDGLCLDDLSEISRTVSAFLDAHDEFAPSGRYQLEVSSPGVERRLRRAEHFRRALGERVAVRTVAGTAGERRAEGIITSVDEDGIAIVFGEGEERRLAFNEMDRAHTVFDWRRALAGARPGDSTPRNKAAQ